MPASHPFAKQLAARNRRVSRYSAQIEADLCRRGLSIGHTDTLIAGVALANGLVLATNNTRHYERIAGLELDNWMQ